MCRATRSACSLIATLHDHHQAIHPLATAITILNIPTHRAIHFMHYSYLPVSISYVHIMYMMILLSQQQVRGNTGLSTMNGVPCTQTHTHTLSRYVYNWLPCVTVVL